MSSPTNPLVSTSVQSSAVESTSSASLPTTSVNVQIAGAVNTAQHGKTSFKTLDEIRKMDAKLYKTMMEGIAYTICRHIKESNERLVEEIRKGREQRR